MISRELGDKSEAPQAFAKLQRKKFWIMILGKLRDKNEAPQAFAKLQRKNTLNNDFRKAWRQKWSTTSFYTMLTNIPNGFVVYAKLESKNSWILISRELGEKNEAPQVPAKLQNKNSWIMILGGLGDKSETY